MDYNTYPKSNFILSDSCSNSLLESEESEYQFYRRIRSLAEANSLKQKHSSISSRMSNPEPNSVDPNQEDATKSKSVGTQNGPNNAASSGNGNRSRPTEKQNNKQAKKSQYHNSPLKYDQVKDLSPRRKVKTRQSALSDSAVLTGTETSKNEEKDSEEKERDKSPTRSKRGQSSPSRKSVYNRSPNRNAYQGEKISNFYFNRDVKTPEFVKRHYDKFCINDMREGTRQQFVLIASTYNTDKTRKEIVQKYKRLIADSTPMNKAVAEQNEKELGKYQRWLDSESRDVGFGSQMDLRNQSYLSHRSARLENGETPSTLTTPRNTKQNKRNEDK